MTEVTAGKPSPISGLIGEFKALKPKQWLGIIAAMFLALLLELYMGTQCFGFFIAAIVLYMIPHMLGVDSVKIKTVYGVIFLVILLVVGTFAFSGSTARTIDRLENVDTLDENIGDLQYDSSTGEFSFDVNPDIDNWSILVTQTPLSGMSTTSGGDRTGEKTQYTLTKEQMSKNADGWYSGDVQLLHESGTMYILEIGITDTSTSSADVIESKTLLIGGSESNDIRNIMYDVLSDTLTFETDSGVQSSDLRIDVNSVSAMSAEDPSVRFVNQYDVASLTSSDVGNETKRWTAENLGLSNDEYYVIDVGILSDSTITSSDTMFVDNVSSLFRNVSLDRESSQLTFEVASGLPEWGIEIQQITATYIYSGVPFASDSNPVVTSVTISDTKTADGWYSGSATLNLPEGYVCQVQVLLMDESGDESTAVAAMTFLVDTGADLTMLQFKGTAQYALYLAVIFFIILIFSAIMRRSAEKTRAKMEAEGRLYPKGYGTCKNCGAMVLPGEVNCRKCGAYIDVPEELKPHKKDSFTCSECGAEVPADAKVCPKCGATFDEEDENIVVHADGTEDVSSENVTCPECGNIVPANADWCPRCGKMLK